AAASAGGRCRGRWCDRSAAGHSRDIAKDDELDSRIAERRKQRQAPQARARPCCTMRLRRLLKKLALRTRSGRVRRWAPRFFPAVRCQVANASFLRASALTAVARAGCRCRAACANRSEHCSTVVTNEYFASLSGRFALSAE